jgi:hypothetical protein
LNTSVLSEDGSGDIDKLSVNRLLAAQPSINHDRC